MKIQVIFLMGDRDFELDVSVEEKILEVPVKVTVEMMKVILHKNNYPYTYLLEHGQVPVNWKMTLQEKIEGMLKYPGVSKEIKCIYDVFVEGSRIDVNGLSPLQIQNLETDLEFYRQFPFIPIENLCSNLENFHPQNDSQKRAFEAIIQQVNQPVRGTPTSGLILSGKGKLGKSHLTFAAAKYLHRTYGLSPRIKFAIEGMKSGYDPQPGQVWVIDDMNCLETGSPDLELFGNLLQYGHMYRGMRIFINTNRLNENLILEYYRNFNMGDRERFRRRIEDIFTVIPVEGEPYHDAP